MVNSLDIKCDSDKQWSTVVYRNIYICIYDHCQVHCILMPFNVNKLKQCNDIDSVANDGS